MLIAITAAQSDDVIRKVLTENNEVDAVVANVVQDAGLSDRYTDEVSILLYYSRSNCDTVCSAMLPSAYVQGCTV